MVLLKPWQPPKRYKEVQRKVKIPYYWNIPLTIHYLSHGLALFHLTSIQDIELGILPDLTRSLTIFFASGRVFFDEKQKFSKFSKTRKVMLYARCADFNGLLGKKHTLRSSVPIPVRSPHSIGNLEEIHELALQWAPFVAFCTTFGVCINEVIILSIYFHSGLSLLIGSVLEQFCKIIFLENIG